LVIGHFGLLVITSCNDDPKKPGYEYMPDMYAHRIMKPIQRIHVCRQQFQQATRCRTIAAEMQSILDVDRCLPVPEYTEGYEAAGKEIAQPAGEDGNKHERRKKIVQQLLHPCHGEKGMGDGTVAKHNGPIPPAYNSAQLKTSRKEKMFHTTRSEKHDGPACIAAHSIPALESDHVCSDHASMAGAAPADSSKGDG